MGVQLGTRLIRSPPLSLEERLPIESHLAFEQMLDGTRQLLGQDGECLTCAMFLLQAGEVFRSCRMVPEAQDGSFSKGPLQMGIADLGA